KQPSLRIAAVAGPRMRKLPIVTAFAMEKLQVMGFIDVLVALPRLMKMFFAIRNEILRLNPKAVICIDYPGFHLRLERSLRKKGYQGNLIHYICPTVWAWGKKRVQAMEKTLDLLLTLLPFEPKCFSNTFAVHYVGHPLVHKIGTFSYQEWGNTEKKILALFPGSRSAEIARNLPLQLSAAKKLQQLDPSLEIAISLAHREREAQIRTYCPDAQLVPPEHNYDLMRKAHMAIAKSGTVTLELALHRVPTVVIYAIQALDVWIARKIFRIDLPFYCIVNILGERRIFPELIGPQLTQPQLDFWAERLWFNREERALCERGCEQVRLLLGERHASQEASQKILDMVSGLGVIEA
ncbi:MAG: lipid-A-disaccharide synthase, partial [Chlamydiia bacterium]|nr:lipid-A-disaccharide synthase [Chlamydiia bacterium]